MYAVEFEASIHNGVVQIPSVFHKLYSRPKAKIIIMIEEDAEITASNKPDFIEMLANNPRHLDESTTFLSKDYAQGNLILFSLLSSIWKMRQTQI